MASPALRSKLLSSSNHKAYGSHLDCSHRSIRQRGRPSPLERSTTCSTTDPKHQLRQHSLTAFSKPNACPLARAMTAPDHHATGFAQSQKHGFQLSRDRLVASHVASLHLRRHYSPRTSALPLLISCWQILPGHGVAWRARVQPPKPSTYSKPTSSLRTNKKAWQSTITSCITEISPANRDLLRRAFRTVPATWTPLCNCSFARRAGNSDRGHWQLPSD